MLDTNSQLSLLKTRFQFRVTPLVHCIERFRLFTRFLTILNTCALRVAHLLMMPAHLLIICVRYFRAITSNVYRDVTWSFCFVAFFCMDNAAAITSSFPTTTCENIILNIHYIILYKALYLVYSHRPLEKNL